MSAEHEDGKPGETPDSEKDPKRSLKQKVGDRMHKEPSPADVKAAASEALALETLVGLLKSENESIRLQAAQIILARPRPAPPTPPGKAALKTVKKVIL